MHIPSLILSFLLFSTMAAQPQRRPVPGFLYTRTRPKCTPQYWISRREAWPRMAPPESSLSKVFGSRASERYRPDLTLLEAAAAAQGGKEAFAALAKQATAALLNAYVRRGYPYAAWEVKTLLIQALVSERMASFQARKFLEANLNCG